MKWRGGQQKRSGSIDYGTDSSVSLSRTGGITDDQVFELSHRVTSWLDEGIMWLFRSRSRSRKWEVRHFPETYPPFFVVKGLSGVDHAGSLPRAR